MNLRLSFSVIFCFLGLYTQALSIDSSHVETKKGEFYYGAYVSPDVSFITVKIRPSESGKTHNWEKYQNGSLVPNAWRVGAIIGFKRNLHWSFETGLQFSNKNLNYYNEVNNEFKNKISPSQASESTSIIHYRCLDLPLRVVFTAGKKRLKFISMVTYNFNYCFNKTQTLESNLPTIGNQQQTYNLGRPDFYLFRSIELHLGVSYQTKSNTILRVSIGAQRTYFAEKTEKYKILFWNMGLQVGFIKPF